MADCRTAVPAVSFILHNSSFILRKKAVHPGSTSAVGLLAAVKAPVRRPDGTRNIKFTVAAFRPWRVSPASIASDPTFNAALRFAYPRHRLPGEFSPARAGCWCREPLPPRLARPNLSKKLEPMVGIEPTTYGLRNGLFLFVRHCSPTNLHNC